MCNKTEQIYNLSICFNYDLDNIEQEIYSCEFNEPEVELIESISTTKQIIYFLLEVFGDAIYDSLDLSVIEAIEDSEFEDILEIRIHASDSDIVYVINLVEKTIDIES